MPEGGDAQRECSGMSAAVSDPLLSRFSDFLVKQMGLHFPAGRAADLKRGIRAAAREFGFQEIGECIQWLMSEPLTRRQIEILASNLTVGETYFYRDKKAFQALEEHVLPELIRTRRGKEQRLRIWSAACCSGEEAYSIAILLRKLLHNLADWRVTILGTDINPRFLHKAADGVFGEWSFRDTPAGFKERHFKKSGEKCWEILPEIRKMVEFSYLNLAEDVYPSVLNNTNGLDLIFCRNVLIYFAPEKGQRVITTLTRCLNDGGWLVPGPNEISWTSPPGLVPTRFSGATIYRKELSRSKAADPGPKKVVKEKPVTSSVSRKLELPSASIHERARASYESGQYAETIQLLAEPGSSEPADPEVMTLLVRALANQGKLAEALVCCDRLIRLDKLNPKGHYLRASILQEQHELNEAASAFKRTLYLDSEFVLAHFALGTLERSKGQFSEANRHFANALALTRKHRPEEILPESEGLTAGRLAEIIRALRESEAGKVNAG